MSMKTSPLQLESIFYPEVSFRAYARPEDTEGQIPVEIRAMVTFSERGTHHAYVEIEQPNEDRNYAFEIKVAVFCAFTIDREAAKRAYPNKGLPGYVATNIARILYSGAREMIASTTARSPFGSANIQSLLIEKEDVHVSVESNGALAESEEEARAVMAQIFDLEPLSEQGTLPGVPDASAIPIT
jgi:preprotein translocase subunit SecB